MPATDAANSRTNSQRSNGANARKVDRSTRGKALLATFRFTGG